MRAVYSTFSAGYSAAAPSEEFIRASTRLGGPLLVYCHGSGHTAASVWASSVQRDLVRRLAQRYTVVVPDLAFQAWGTDTHFARIADVIAHMRTNYGSTGPVTLLGGSMGALGAFGYARANPNEVRALVGLIPGLDINDLLSRGPGAEINAAYGGAYNDATHGPTHSPVRYAATLPASMPIRLFTASNDATTVPATADAFVAARPVTGRIDIGPAGHSDTAVAAATPLITRWLSTT